MVHLREGVKIEKVSMEIEMIKRLKDEKEGRV